MEFDNDRIVKGIPAIVVGCWIVFMLLPPLVNSLGAFPYQPIAWPFLLIVSLLTAPLYIVFARIAVTRFLFTKRYSFFAVCCIALVLAVHACTWILFQMMPASLPLNVQKYFSYASAGLARETVWICMLTILAIAISYLSSQLQEREQVTALHKENTFYKLRYFRSQLNPHFLFNTLNSIYSLSLQQSDKTPGVIIRLSDLMRFMIYECNEEKIPIEKEIGFIRNYIEIEKLRYDADIQFTVDGDATGLMVEPFLFISFIENGFKHAIDNSFARPFIYITLKIRSGQIALNVINNTSLELEAQAKNIRGKSLENSKTVLELLYPEAYELDIIQTEKKERKDSKLRLKHAHDRLQRLYPDAHTLDVILSNNTFTVSLILNNASFDKMYHYRG